jgi:hypothetical protein
MIRFLVLHIGAVFAFIFVARRTLRTRHSIPARIRIFHYASLSFLTFMNISGWSRASWTLQRLVAGDLLASMDEYFIALRELPHFLAVVVWACAVVGPSTTGVLTLRIARLNERSRATLLRLFPVLVLTDALSSCIDIRGSGGIGLARSSIAEYAIAFCVWACVAWPYIFAYRFYRSDSTDVLFSSIEPLVNEPNDGLQGQGTVPR